MKGIDTTITSPVLVLVGPTAVGKTDLSIKIAHRFNCEVISMDSMQVYRYMNIGTAKIRPEEMDGVPHHLIDIRNPDQQYDAASFVADTLESIEGITSRGNIPLITGGTGLYLNSLINGLFDNVTVEESVRQRVGNLLKEEGREACFDRLKSIDPKSAERIHKNDTQRLLRGLEIFYGTGIPWSEHIRRQKQRSTRDRFTNILILALHSDRERLYKRIEQRAGIMLEQGLVDEVAGLMDMGYGADLPSMNSIGYRQIVKLLTGQYGLEEAKGEIVRDTRRYAKRQFTWFNKVDALQWVEHDRHDHIIGRIDAFLNNDGRSRRQ